MHADQPQLRTDALPLTPTTCFPGWRHPCALRACACTYRAPLEPAPSDSSPAIKQSLHRALQILCVARARIQDREPTQGPASAEDSKAMP